MSTIISGDFIKEVTLTLDTNAYAELRRGHPGVADLVRRARRVLFSPFVAGELMYGFRMGSRAQQNRRDLEAFLASPHVELLPVTLVTADRFALVAQSLKRKGKPIPSNDVWIAAHALESGADLVSFDRHFEHVDGLAWIDPSGP